MKFLITSFWVLLVLGALLLTLSYFSMGSATTLSLSTGSFFLGIASLTVATILLLVILILKIKDPY